MKQLLLSSLLCVSLLGCGREMMPKSRAVSYSAWSSELVNYAIENDPDYTESDRDRLRNSQKEWLLYITNSEANNDGE